MSVDPRRPSLDAGVLPRSLGTLWRWGTLRLAIGHACLNHGVTAPKMGNDQWWLEGHCSPVECQLKAEHEYPMVAEEGIQQFSINSTKFSYNRVKSEATSRSESMVGMTHRIEAG